MSTLTASSAVSRRPAIITAVTARLTIRGPRQQLTRMILTASLALALTFVGLAVTSGTAKAAPDDGNIARMCQIILANPTPDEAGFTQGACVAYLTNGNNLPILASVCRLPEGLAFAEQVSARADLTHGQCIGVLRGLTPPQ